MENQQTDNQNANADTQQTTNQTTGLLDTTGTQTSGTTGAQPDTSGFLFPEKYEIKNADGSVDVNASTAKLIEGYKNISKKMGETGGLVPDSPEKYKIEFDPEKLGIPNTVTADTLQGDEEFQKFLQDAHTAGITNEQINLITGKYLQHTYKMLDSKMQMDADHAQEELSKLWGEDKFEKNLSVAQKALNAFTTPEERKELGALSNNPKFIALLAKVGEHIGEDTPSVQATQAGSRESIDALMRSPAYLDPTHADYNRVQAEIKAHYARVYGQQPI